MVFIVVSVKIISAQNHLEILTVVPWADGHHQSSWSFLCCEHTDAIVSIAMEQSLLHWTLKTEHSRRGDAHSMFLQVSESRRRLIFSMPAKAAFTSSRTPLAHSLESLTPCR